MDLAALCARREHNLSHERANGLGCLEAGFRIGQRFGEPLDPGAIALGDAGVDCWQRLWRRGEPRLQPHLLPLAWSQAVLPRRFVESVLHTRHDAVYAPLTLCPRRALGPTSLEPHPLHAVGPHPTRPDARP